MGTCACASACASAAVAPVAAPVAASAAAPAAAGAAHELDDPGADGFVSAEDLGLVGALGPGEVVASGGLLVEIPLRVHDPSEGATLPDLRDACQRLGGPFGLRSRLHGGLEAVGEMAG